MIKRGIYAVIRIKLPIDYALAVRVTSDPPLDILSNEALHSAFPCTEIGVGGFRGASQAIREIHFVGEMRLALSFGKAGGYGCSTGCIRHARLRTSC